MMTFSEFVASKHSLQEVQMTKISSAHNTINPAPNLQKILNYASQNSKLSAQQLAFLSKNILDQSILTSRKMKLFPQAQQTLIITEQIAIVAAISHLLALCIQKEILDSK